MTSQYARFAMLGTRLHVLQQVASLESGFAKLVEGNGITDWKDVVEPWPGQVRLVPAANAFNLSHWRYGTANDLAGWVLSGCHEWRDERQPVVAVGTRYISQLPVVYPEVRGGNVRMLTVSLNKTPQRDTPAAWLRLFLRDKPNALALCVVPRG